MVEAGRERLEDMVSEVDKGTIVRRFSGSVGPESGELLGIAERKLC